MNRKLKKFLSFRSAFAVIFFILLVLYCISLFLPLGWGLLTTFKSRGEFRTNILGFPQDFTFSNYIYAFQNMDVPVPLGNGQIGYSTLMMQFVNSFLYAGGCALAAAIVICITAYATAKFDYFFSKIIYAIVVITMVLPIVGALPSEIQMARLFGLFDSIPGMWIMRANFLGIYYLVFYSTFKGVAKEYSEAAYIDGASEWRVMTRVLLPIVSPIFLTVVLLKFIEFWNDYQIPLIYLPSYPTVSYGVFTFGNTNATEASSVPMGLTGCFLLLLPVLVIFLVFSKRLIGNVSMGGIKD